MVATHVDTKFPSPFPTKILALLVVQILECTWLLDESSSGMVYKKSHNESKNNGDKNP